MPEQQPTLAPESLPQSEKLRIPERAKRAWEKFKDKSHYLGLSTIALLTLALQGDMPNRIPAVPEYFPPADDPHALYLEPTEPRFVIEPQTQRPPVVAYVPPVRTPATITATAEVTQAAPASSTPESTPETFQAIDSFVSEGLSLLTDSSMSFNLPKEIADYLGIPRDKTFTLDFRAITEKNIPQSVQDLVDDYNNNPNLALVFAGTDGSVVINAHSFYRDIFGLEELPFQWMNRLIESNPDVAINQQVELVGKDINGNEVNRNATITQIVEVTKEVYEGALVRLEHIEGSPLYLDPEKLGFEPNPKGELVIYLAACSGEKTPDGKDRKDRVIARLILDEITQ